MASGVQSAALNHENSVFADLSLEQVLEEILDEIANLYLSNDLPWVVGYSGGKDSTATLHLVWLALQKISSEDAKKPVYVISTDTLVENPIVAGWVSNSLEKMNRVARQQKLPITSHRLTPELEDSFWVNLIGRGYPAPRQKFRWCTERLKIRPANKFISSIVDKYGEALVVLGTRKAESVARAKTMERHRSDNTPARVNPNGSLPNSFVYTPIEDWSNDDVWFFLLETPNPWGHDNMDLFTLYKGASADGECPMVVGSGTPSCGDSRFGCWVCTLVEKDKSMQAMIQNDEDKEWMMPLLEIRNEIDFRAMSQENGDRPLRDFRRMNGTVQLFNGRTIPGPYKQKFRKHLLRRVLETEKKVRETGPDYVRNLTLIQPEELEEIRRIWVVEKHEIEDCLPHIYEETTGEKYQGNTPIDGLPFNDNDIGLLKDVCGDSQETFEMLREMISIENRHKTALRRTGIFKLLEKSVERNLYQGEEEAVAEIKRKNFLISEYAKSGPERTTQILRNTGDDS